MLLGENLRKAREEKGLTQAEVAKLLDISASTIGMYEQGRRDPDTDTLKKLAELYEVSTDYLLGRTDIPNATSDLKKNKIPEEFIKLLKDQNGSLPYSAVTRVLKIFSPTDKSKTKILPVLGTIRTGIPILADEHVEDILEVPDYIKGDYILRVQGDSMVGAGILEGDLVICKESQVAQSGQIVVALHDLATGISEATLKYFFDNGKGPLLRAANPSYLDIDMRKGYRIVGVMVGLIRMDAPSYQAYREFLSVRDHEEWARTIETALGKGLTPEDIIYLIDMQTRISEKMSSDKLMHNYLLSNPNFDFDVNEYTKTPPGEKIKRTPSGRRLSPIPKLDE